jgi:predicted ATPase
MKAAIRAMIDHVTIRNFRSLVDVTVPLGPLTVLVGPNASGKSNIINALRMVHELAGGSRLDDFLAARGGYGQVAWGGESDRDISAELGWANPVLRKEEPAAYSLLIGLQANKPVIQEERALVNDVQPLSRRLGEAVAYQGQRHGGVDPQSSVRAVVADTWPVAQVFQEIRNWAFYQLSPRNMKQPKPVQKEYRLSEDGGNLSTVIHTLFSEGAPAFQQIEEFIRSVLPNVERLLSPIAGSNLTNVALKERGVPTPIGSWGLSDGTLFALALSTARYTPERPSLLALEAPDTELHPYVLEAIAELLVEASRHTQVLVTTHSPYLLDHLPVESLLVVEKKQGATTCRRVKTRVQARKAIQQLGAGKAWYAGHLGGVP